MFSNTGHKHERIFYHIILIIQALDDESNKYGQLSLSLVKSRVYLDTFSEPEGIYACIGEAEPREPGEMKQQIISQTKVVIPGSLNKEAEGFENSIDMSKPINAL